VLVGCPFVLDLRREILCSVPAARKIEPDHIDLGTLACGWCKRPAPNEGVRARKRQRYRTVLGWKRDCAIGDAAVQCPRTVRSAFGTSRTAASRWCLGLALKSNCSATSRRDAPPLTSPITRIRIHQDTIRALLLLRINAHRIAPLPALESPPIHFGRKCFK
jgi:hypothetical protein